MSRLRRLLTVSALALAVSAPLAAQAQDKPALTEAQKNEVRALIRETMVNNPDILREAFMALQQQEEQRAEEQRMQGIKAHAKQLFNGDDPVLGNPKGDVTLVEFFDYRCGYCKAVMDGVMEVVKADGNVRLVLKEFPILGPESVVAARYALASRAQGKYAEFHRALMMHRGDYTDESIKQIAQEVGLNVERLAKDAADPAIQKALIDNRALAEALGVSGTPAFITPTSFLPGAAKPEQLKQAIAEARKAQKG